MPRPAPGLRLTLDEYEAMIAEGEIPEDWNVELVEGELIEMFSAGPPHEDLVDYLAEWSFTVLRGTEWKVRVQNSLLLRPQQSLLEPDLTWVRRRRYSQRRVVPDETLLVIEVSDSSLPYDQGRKLALYARSGVAEVWIVSVAERSIESHSRPVDGIFTKRAVAREGESLAPVGLPEARLDLSELFGGVEEE
jgi:Uma2 family endonuclease